MSFLLGCVWKYWWKFNGVRLDRFKTLPLPGNITANFLDSAESARHGLATNEIFLLNQWMEDRYFSIIVLRMWQQFRAVHVPAGCVGISVVYPGMSMYWSDGSRCAGVGRTTTIASLTSCPLPPARLAPGECCPPGSQYAANIHTCERRSDWRLPCVAPGHNWSIPAGRISEQPADTMTWVEGGGITILTLLTTRPHKLY